MRRSLPRPRPGSGGGAPPGRGQSHAFLSPESIANRLTDVSGARVLLEKSLSLKADFLYAQNALRNIQASLKVPQP